LKTITVPRWIKVVSNIFVVLTPILSLLFIDPEFMRPFIPLPIFLTIKQVTYPIICISFLFFIFVVLSSNIRQAFKVTFIIMMSILFCISEFGVFGNGIVSTEILLNTAQVENKRYNLVQIIPLEDSSSPCYLYKCDVNDLGCEEIGSYYGNCWGRKDSALVVNQKTNEINVFIERSIGLNLDFTYGEQPRSYMDKLQLSDYDYYLAYFHDYDAWNSPYEYMLYKCEKDTVNCSRLPFYYVSDRDNFYGYGYLEFDEHNNEIKVLILNELIYTYGNSPNCYVDGCSLSDK
jgi:hypothetical protein